MSTTAFFGVGIFFADFKLKLPPCGRAFIWLNILSVEPNSKFLYFYNCHGQTVFWPRPAHNEA